MADIKTQTSVADELKTAAQQLRCDHRYPCQPPHGQVWAPGPCLHCGQDHPDDDEIVPDALREPLAAWLAFEAAIYEQIPADRQGACTPEHALAVARALNGSVS
jgi:hypothetical protein